ncbi:MAG TPA: FAD-binding oxidoreductase [Chloroflexota bacterium]
MQALPGTADVVVIGAGAIGCSVAYHLAEMHVADVVVLEQHTIGSGTTSKAAGGIRAQFGTPTEIIFSLEALDFFRSCKQRLGVDAEFRQIGYLTLISSEDDLRLFEQRVALQRRYGVDVSVIGADDARHLVPALRTDDLIAAVHCPTDGYAGPSEVTMGFVARARERGVRFLEGVTTSGVRRAGGRVTGVETSAGFIAAPVVVNAAGPAAARVGRMVDADLKVLPRRRHIFVTEDFPRLPGPVPLTQDRSSGFYFRKELERVLMSPGDVEDIHSDGEVPVDWTRLEETVDKAIKRVPLLAEARITSGWAGLRPLTPDEHALIGELPDVPGFFVAVGFCGHGFQHAPPAGKHLAELIVQGRSSVDLALFDPMRSFQGGPERQQPGAAEVKGANGPR